MNQITTQYVTENGACYEQYVITRVGVEKFLMYEDGDHFS